MHKLRELHPDIEKKSLEFFQNTLERDESRIRKTKNRILFISRLMEIKKDAKFCVIGSGPKPETIRAIDSLGYDVTGIEPVKKFVDAANLFLEKEVVKVGSAESIPFPDNTFDVVFCESVLEHVDSPEISLKEMHRVLKSNSILYLVTTNKHKLSLTGHNGEYNIPFFNWLPKNVKEGYVLKHLHFKPSLANYTSLPAVHWFTFSKLCELGRFSGFRRFYSLFDVILETDDVVKKNFLKRFIVKHAITRPWLRAIVLRQYGACIFMVKP